jgi:hypothetical protein
LAQLEVDDLGLAFSKVVVTVAGFLLAAHLAL